MTMSERSRALADGLGQPIEVVADDGLEVDVDAERGQARRDVRGVRVDDLAEQDLGADGEDFCLHGVERSKWVAERERSTGRDRRGRLSPHAWGCIDGGDSSDR